MSDQCVMYPVKSGGIVSDDEESNQNYSFIISLYYYIIHLARIFFAANATIYQNGRCRSPEHLRVRK